jgi:hypothetical protein
MENLGEIHLNCPACGEPIETGASLCGRCTNPILAELPPGPVDGPAPESVPRSRPELGTPPVHEPGPRPAISGLLIILKCLFLIVRRLFLGLIGIVLGCVAALISVAVNLLILSKFDFGSGTDEYFRRVTNFARLAAGGALLTQVTLIVYLLVVIDRSLSRR